MPCVGCAAAGRWMVSCWRWTMLRPPPRPGRVFANAGAGCAGSALPAAGLSVATPRQRLAAGYAHYPDAGGVVPAAGRPQDVERQLRAILPAMLAQGTQQLCADSSHDYLLRVAKWLKEGGISGWKTLLTPWLTGYLQQIRSAVCCSAPR